MMMRHHVVLTIILLLLFNTSLSGQATYFCGTDKIGAMLATSSEYVQTKEQYERNYRRWMARRFAKIKHKQASEYVLPVVFHIVHDCTPLGSQGNPTNASIEAVLNRTSQRFRHRHPTAQQYENPHYGIDTNISFCLATATPKGDYTTGIVRHNNAEYSTGNSFDQSTFFSENYRWDTNRYINIFIVEDTDVAGVYAGGSSRDIIIINASSFWDGLLVHELGHYFSLRHIFSPDADENCPENNNCLINGDFVCDTPPKSRPGMNRGTCVAPANSCTSDENDTGEHNPYRPVAFGGMGDQPDMLSNYMDYTGRCWDAFTAGQKRRMIFNLENKRVALINSNSSVCNAPLPEYDLAVEAVQLMPIPNTADWQINIIIKNNGTQTVHTSQIDVQIGTSSYIFSPIFNLVPEDTTLITLPIAEPMAGRNDVKISIAAPNGVVDAYKNDNQYCTFIDRILSDIEVNPDSMVLPCKPVTYDTIVNACPRIPIEGYIGPGVFKDTFSLANGCDSIRTLTINVILQRIITRVEQSICAGDSFEGHSEKGSYVDLFQSTTGCDSVRVLDLTIEPIPTTQQQVMICEGESYDGYFTPGTHTDTVSTITGCDSIVITQLTIEKCTTTSTTVVPIDDLLQVYPNPAFREFHIEWTGNEVLTYSIFTATGIRILNSQSLSSYSIIPIRHLPKGLYFINFQSKNRHCTKKIIVQ